MKTVRYIPRLPLREEDPFAFDQPSISCYEAPAHDFVTQSLGDVPLALLHAEVEERKRWRAAKLERKRQK